MGHTNFFFWILYSDQMNLIDAIRVHWLIFIDKFDNSRQGQSEFWKGIVFTIKNNWIAILGPSGLVNGRVKEVDGLSEKVLLLKTSALSQNHRKGSRCNLTQVNGQNTIVSEGLC